MASQGALPAATVGYVAGVRAFRKAITKYRNPAPSVPVVKHGQFLSIQCWSPKSYSIAVDTIRSYNGIMFVWDDDKRQGNLRKHKIDFVDAEKIFRGITLTVEDDRETYGEQRFLTLGMLEDQVVSVTHTERAEKIRLISIRKATKHEARFYFSQITY